MGNRLTSRWIRLSHAMRYGKLCIGREPGRLLLLQLEGEREEQKQVAPLEEVALE